MPVPIIGAIFGGGAAIILMRKYITYQLDKVIAEKHKECIQELSVEIRDISQKFAINTIRNFFVVGYAVILQLIIDYLYNWILNYPRDHWIVLDTACIVLFFVFLLRLCNYTIDSLKKFGSIWPPTMLRNEISRRYKKRRKDETNMIDEAAIFICGQSEAELQKKIIGPERELWIIIFSLMWPSLLFWCFYAAFGSFLMWNGSFDSFFPRVWHDILQTPFMLLLYLIIIAFFINLELCEAISIKQCFWKCLKLPLIWIREVGAIFYFIWKKFINLWK